MLDYDVLILGGGIVGCNIAYELSKFSINIALIEREHEIADNVSYIDIPLIDNESADMEFKRRLNMEKVAQKLKTRIFKCNYVEINHNNKNLINCSEGYLDELKNALKNISINTAAYYKNFNVINIYDLATGYGEIAFDNGVNFRLDETVKKIIKVTDGYKIITNKNKFTCRIVINTMPDRKINLNYNKNTYYSLKYFLIDKSYGYDLENVISIKSKNGNKTVLVPNPEGDIYAYVFLKEDSDELKELKLILHSLDDKYIKEMYDLPYNNKGIRVDSSEINNGYIKIVGKYYGKASCIPSVAKDVSNIIVKKYNYKLKKDFHDKRRECYRFRYMSDKERNKVIKTDNKYGRIICSCAEVTEGEIVECIRRPLGARTMDGIKKRTGAMSSSCGGSRCMMKIAAILARETNKSITEVIKHSTNSNILVGRIKEFDKV
ncbi:MAG: FAD-dependent oxidoreductase [Clostridium sp.]|nr:FAD-dependent oxidoreductase [Clostridium sp.]